MTIAPEEKLYWLGNVAKTRVIREIIHRSNGSCTIFDFGAGDGGDWPSVMADFPELKIIFFEPNPRRAEKLCSRVGTLNGKVISRLDELMRPVDYVVSFSVFEHVYKREAYLRNAAAVLREGGSLFLNYDDGHFRVNIDLSNPRSWIARIASQVHNSLWFLLPKIGLVGKYQRRVHPLEIADLVAGAGLSVVGDYYENTESFKALAKKVPVAKQREFSRFWLEAEKQLNEKFRSDGPSMFWDTTNLWSVMASRTLELKK